MHIGHLRMMQSAAKIGRVVVIVNSDEWLLRKKGYVFTPLLERRELLEGFACVAETVVVDDLDNSVCEALELIKPDYFVNGGDRKNENTPEVQFCERLGIELLWGMGGGKVQSSSELCGSRV